MAATGIEHIQNLIEAKKDKISSLASQIQELTRIREGEIRELAELQMMLLPIGKLPTELLAEVFRFHVPGVMFRAKNNTASIIAAAHCVSQVCSRWRLIAHGTPRLWVDGFSCAVDAETTELDLTQTTAWLERSHPLPITVYFHHISGRTTDSSGTPAFRALLSAARRWKHVIWRIPSLSPLLDLAPGSLEAFERFTLQSLRFQPPEQAVDIFATSPRLREIDLGIDHDRDLGFLCLPWKQLTKFIFRGTLNQCLEIMLQCVNLVSIDLSSCEWDFSVQTPTPPIVVLPLLEDLKIYFTFLNNSDICRIDPFFAPLALPALKTLDLYFESYGVELVWDASQFAEFQDRSPSIEKIVFRSGQCTFGTDSLISLLRHSPSLTELKIELEGCGIDDTFLHALQFSEDDPQPLVPNLRRLELIEIGSQPSDSALEAMIRSRWWTGVAPYLPGVARLQQLTVERDWRLGEEISRELRERFQDCEAQGLIMDFD
ncbi:hypothetical protein C8R44DRAFT_776319 [Mycena epipterygia]|nr:hypothetical protein C8R44DRAFT_776319 [Mycena epipterygia]